MLAGIAPVPLTMFQSPLRDEAYTKFPRTFQKDEIEHSGRP
jgi:hypothetical protein